MLAKYAGQYLVVVQALTCAPLDVPLVVLQVIEGADGERNLPEDKLLVAMCMDHFLPTPKLYKWG